MLAEDNVDAAEDAFLGVSEAEERGGVGVGAYPFLMDGEGVTSFGVGGFGV